MGLSSLAVRRPGNRSLSGQSKGLKGMEGPSETVNELLVKINISHSNVNFDVISLVSPPF